MSRVRVYQLARETGLDNRQVLDRLRALGIDASTHSSAVSAVDAQRLRDALEQERVPVAPTPTLRRVLGHLRPHRRVLLGLLLIDLLSTPLLLLAPIPLKIAIDSVLGDQPLPGYVSPFVPDVLTETSLRLLLVVAALQVLVVLLGEGQRLASYVGHTSVGERITMAFRGTLFRHTQDLSLTYHDSRGGADSRYRIEYDAPALQHLVDGTLPFVSAAVSLVVTLGVIASIDVQLALVALVVMPVLFVLTRKRVGGFREAYKAQRQLESRAFGVLQEVFASLRVVKAFARQDSEHRRFQARAQESLDARVRLALAEGLYGMAISITAAVGTALVLLIGVRRVEAGAITLGDLLVVIAYLAALYQPLKEAAQKVGDLQASMAGAERAFELLDEATEVPDRPNPMPLDRAAGDVEFEGVSFGYDGHPVLRGVSFFIEPGGRLGIRGRTGAGKTTLINLLLRFYDPDGGRVLLDGIDVRDYRVADLRRQFALVLQDPVLFSTSIRENIAYGRPDATMDQVVEAARSANAHDFICALPDGYETLVGERGMRLSGGERQRVSIARAFLKDAPILVLDEPTSSVDVQTETAILEAMERLMAGRTTIMIAHRLSTLDLCDTTIEIGRGRVLSTSYSQQETA